MKNHLHLFALITLGVCASLSLTYLKASALDINLNGNANLNFNPINNNKYSTQMKNFSPGNIPLQQVDLSPLATPPTTSEIKTFGGNKINVDIVDKDANNAKEFKELQRKTGQLVGAAPEPVADDQGVKDTDIQDFLGNYYKYLRSEGLSSGSLPVVPNNITPTKTQPATKQKTSSSNIKAHSKQLKAKQEKLFIGKTASSLKDQSSKAP